jgi:NAD(P)-dependent dehydrogenase (short-subunit alcohol dehydrogenase family)
MTYLDSLSYKGKRAVVTGAASGMGEATVNILAEFGAETIGLDIKPVKGPVAKFIQTDLGDKASIEGAVGQISGRIDALFNIAGMAGLPGTEFQTMLVNYVGHRHLTEALLPRMPAGGAIVNVSSLAGFLYIEKKDELMPLIEISSFDEAKAWLEKNPDKYNGYGTSKQLLNLWAAAKCKEYAEKYGVRINAVGPGSTDTPLLPVFMEGARLRTGSDEGVHRSKGFLGRFSHAEDQAWACVFLNSAAASMITGQVLYVDGGMAGARVSGVLPAPTAVPQPRPAPR